MSQALHDLVDMLESVAWGAIHDVDPAEQLDLRARIRQIARAREWRVRSTYKSGLRLVTVVRPAPAPITTRRAAPAR